MVGIVIVAHSAKLAEAVVELSKQMLRQEVPMVAAGGTGDPEAPFGTNAMLIQKAIESVYSSDGVLVFMDIGSAILSAETALELLSETQRAMVRLCEAPLVEGTIAAAVRAEGGGSLEEVADEARGTLAAKAAQLSLDIPQTKPAVSPEVTLASKELHLIIKNRLGIHARPAAKFVAAANRFKSNITVRNLSRNTPVVSARSINSLFTLGTRQGHEIVVSAAGPDADEALLALRELVDRNFDEAEDQAINPAVKEISGTPVVKDKYTGIPVAPGIAIGPLVQYRPTLPEIPVRKNTNPEVECKRLEDAVSVTRYDIRAIRDKARARAGDYEAAIFDAHLICLEDPALLESARRKIFERKMIAEASWLSAMDEMIASYQALDDLYLRSRSADLVDLKTQVLRKLTGVPLPPLELIEPAVLIAADLKPSDITRLDSDKLLGIITALGNAGSHSAILARSLGIPVVFGLGTEILSLAEGTTIVVNGIEGWVVASPPDITPYKKQHNSWIRSKKAEQKASRQSAVTADGKHIRVMANAGSVTEARRAKDFGAEGIGLLRTEFLFLERSTAPGEEEQFAVYNSMAESMGDYPVTIRTLDAGGDKPLPFLNQQDEANPFLGERGIRLYLNHADIFKTQLRAILRASEAHRLKIILPMVTSMNEVRCARSLLEEAKQELTKAQIPFKENIEVGIMIETPSAVVIADRLAKEADFFSIGTNDLSQYIMAADRANARVASLSDPFHPAVLSMIQQAIKSGHEADITVGVCGEMAGEPLAAPLLLGLGVDELSMNFYAIASVKKMISRIKMSDAEKLASGALKFDSAEEVKHYVADIYPPTKQAGDNLEYGNEKRGIDSGREKGGEV